MTMAPGPRRLSAGSAPAPDADLSATPGPESDTSHRVVGLVLAAGAGRRLGGPKALVTDESGETWLARAVRVVRDGGCSAVHVVLGAAAAEIRPTLPEGVEVVIVENWAEGMGTSLGAGLTALAAATTGSVSSALVMLVDTPDVSAGVVRRVLAVADRVPEALGRAAYGGEPGHPVLIGRNHWAGVVGSARGDRGARDYLAAHPAELVECGDLATGEDVDNADELERWRHIQGGGRARARHPPPATG